jgi:uncharacterized protein (DUF433 family)
LGCWFLYARPVRMGGLRSKLDRVVLDPKILGGKPVIKGTRIAVYLIVELLASGMTEEKLLREYPSLRKEDIRAALEYASRILREEEVIPIEAK